VSGIDEQEIIRRPAYGLQCSESRRAGPYDDDVYVRLDGLACSVKEENTAIFRNATSEEYSAICMPLRGHLNRAFTVRERTVLRIPDAHTFPTLQIEARRVGLYSDVSRYCHFDTAYISLGRST
jgi:hypothetical protein